MESLLKKIIKKNQLKQSWSFHHVETKSKPYKEFIRLFSKI